MLKRWDAFTRFLTDGRVCLSKNAAERALRGIALGRKSWLFAGSDRGGQRAAMIISPIATAKMNDFDPQAWLADVLARIAEHPANRLNETASVGMEKGRARALRRLKRSALGLQRKDTDSRSLSHLQYQHFKIKSRPDAGHPPFERSPRGPTASREGRNNSKSTSDLVRSRRSLLDDNSFSRSSTSKNLRDH